MENLFEKYNEFIKFDTLDIEERLHTLPSIIGYYQNIFYTIKKKHTKYHFELDQKWQERYLYYKNDFNFTLTNAEIKSFIEKDLEYLKIKKKVTELSDLLEQIELILKGLDNTRWAIHDLISWKKFQAGEF